MKVNQLREYLAEIPGDWDVTIEDLNGACISLSGVGHTAPVVHLNTPHFFPLDWFGQNYEEIDVRCKGIKRDTTPRTEEILITDKMAPGEELSVDLTFYDGYAVRDGVHMRYPKLEELSDAQIRAINEYTGGAVFDSGFITPHDVCLLYGELTEFGVMDDGNGHDPELVNKINRLWIKKKNKFRPILVALYERDIDEITDADCFQLPKWTDSAEYERGKESKDWQLYNNMCLRDMTFNWDAYAWNYLQHIADDGDLKAILYYVR